MKIRIPINPGWWWQETRTANGPETTDMGVRGDGMRGSPTWMVIAVALTFIAGAVTICMGTVAHGVEPVIAHAPSGLSLTDEEKAWLKTAPVIRVGVDPAWQPVEYLDEKGELKGISSDYLKIVSQKLGLRFEVVRLDWSNAIEAAKQRRIDMFTCISRTPQRTEYLDFTRPYLKMPLVVYTLNSHPYIYDFAKLKGQKVVVQENTLAHEEMAREYPGVYLVLIEKTKDAFDILTRGEAVAFVDSIATGSYYLAKLGYTNVKVNGQVPYHNDSCMGVRNDWPVAVGILQKALDSISEDERDAINQRWIFVKYEHGSDYSLLWKLLAAGFAVFCLIAYWNRRLSREISVRMKAEEELKRHREHLEETVKERSAELVAKNDLLFEEIAERKLAEKTLRDSEKEFRSLADSMPQIVWVTRPDGWNIYCNRQWVDYTGLTLEESYGHGWNTPFHPDDKRRAWDAWQHATQNDKTYSLECRLRRKDGAYRWWLIRGVPVRDDSGMILKWFGTCTDIEDMKQAENEKARLEAHLRQAQKMEAVGQLAGGVAHDFNNMLSVITGYSEMLLVEMTPSDPKYGRVREIHKAGLRSAELTQQLLAFARKQTIAPKVLDLNDTVTGMLNMLQRLIGENIELLWKPHANLWKVKMDASQINQILANLIVNARDAISSAGRIAIETGKADLDEAFCEAHPDFTPGKYVVLEFSDNGCGMGKEILEHIFEPFFTTKKVGQGTGLGLATVFGIVKQNNGVINIYSEPGKGTTFKIYLPRYESEGLGDGKDEELATAKMFTGIETVLLVEDEKALLQFANILLERLGYTVLTADCPGQAIRIAGEYKGEIHLLMTDVVMPEMSGRDLKEKIYAMRPGIKCLFMSGYTADIMSHDGVLDEGIYFLEKPFTSEALSAKLRETLA
ncbi:MAG: transporter substrate-binding domain-containing protein [Victivallales bacterium]